MKRNCYSDEEVIFGGNTLTCCCCSENNIEKRKNDSQLTHFTLFYSTKRSKNRSTFLSFSELPTWRKAAWRQRFRRTLALPWGNEDTQQLIDILGRYNIKTTFFVVGDWVERYPESVAQLHDAGMEIMNHSNDHAHYNSLSAEEIIADVTACNEKIAAITGVTPTLIRCPYGEYDDHVIAAIRSMGMEPIQWDVDSLDWKDYDAATICERVTSRVKEGSIVLFHNAALHTPEALPQILEYLIHEGFTVVPISELLLEGEYTIDHTGRQWPVVEENAE